MSPIYEYRCNVCGKKFTKLLKMPLNEQEEQGQKYMRCPECEGVGVKIPSINSFILKGTGWAKDGYKERTVKKAVRDLIVSYPYMADYKTGIYPEGSGISGWEIEHAHPKHQMSGLRELRRLKAEFHKTGRFSYMKKTINTKWGLRFLNGSKITI